MIGKLLETEEINTDADSSLKGLGLQKLRAVERLLSALIEDKKAVVCTIEHIDDVLEVDISGDKVAYTTEQNKSYQSSFSMNSQEIKNTLRIFFDNWRVKVESSESIKFVFYTNTIIAKENKVKALKSIKEDLPDQPLLEKLINKEYDEILMFIIPIFKEYYLQQHSKHTNDIDTYEKLIDSMNEEKWVEFFNSIEWNFGERDENEVRKSVVKTVEKLCYKYSVEQKFVDIIVAKLIDMVESRTSEKDFLERVVHVGEVKALFLELVQEVKVIEKLDPTYTKWDEIQCDDIRDINEKIISVCPEYTQWMIDDLQEEYIDGSFEQKQYHDNREIKAYNYRIYMICKKLVRRRIQEQTASFTQADIDGILEDLTNEAEKLILDKGKTYKIPFKDRDMVRKTIILLFQECYLAFDERSAING